RRRKQLGPVCAFDADGGALPVGIVRDVDVSQDSPVVVSDQVLHSVLQVVGARLRAASMWPTLAAGGASPATCWATLGGECSEPAPAVVTGRGGLGVVRLAQREARALACWRSRRAVASASCCRWRSPNEAVIPLRWRLTVMPTRGGPCTARRSEAAWEEYPAASRSSMVRNTSASRSRVGSMSASSLPPREKTYLKLAGGLGSTRRRNRLTSLVYA